MSDRGLEIQDASRLAEETSGISEIVKVQNAGAEDCRKSQVLKICKGLGQESCLWFCTVETVPTSRNEIVGSGISKDYGVLW